MCTLLLSAGVPEVALLNDGELHQAQASLLSGSSLAKPFEQGGEWAGYKWFQTHFSKGLGDYH